MSQGTCCRLCANFCDDYISLCDETGRCNVYLYEITVKYFHPMILSLINRRQRTVMCMECWRQIFEFNNFQKAILEAQSKLKLAKEQALAVNNDVAMRTAEANYDEKLNAYLVAVKEDWELLDTRHAICVTGNSDANRMDPNTNYAFPDRECEVPSNVIPDDCYACPDAECEVPLNVTSDDYDNSTCYANNESLHEEYDEPVGIFAGSELIRGHVNMPPYHQSPADVIALDSDDEISIRANVASWLSVNPSFVSLEYNDYNDKLIQRNTSSPNFSTKQSRRHKSRKPVDNYIANWRPMLDCPLCHAPFPDMVCLGEHFSWEHPHERCHIVCCQQKFYSRCMIAEHARFHLEPPLAIKCELCGETYESNTLEAGTLVQHQIRKRSRDSMVFEPKGNHI